MISKRQENALRHSIIRSRNLVEYAENLMSIQNIMDEVKKRGGAKNVRSRRR